MTKKDKNDFIEFKAVDETSIYDALKSKHVLVVIGLVIIVMLGFFANSLSTKTYTPLDLAVDTQKPLVAKEITEDTEGENCYLAPQEKTIIKPLNCSELVLLIEKSVNLKDSVLDGNNYSQDLAFIGFKLAGNANVAAELATLKKFVNNPIKPITSLEKEFGQLSSKLIIAELKDNKSASFWNLIEYYLAKFITIRKTENFSSNTDGVDSIITRTSALLNKSNIDGAIEELEKLKGMPGQISQLFLNEMRNNQDVTSAAKNIYNYIIRNLDCESQKQENNKGYEEI
jgi:inner membrane protein